MTALYFDHLRAARPGVGQAARRAGPARDRVPARPARPRVPDRRCAQFGGLQSYPSRAQGPRSRPTSRPARSGSARRRRSGARSRTATSPATSTCPQGGRQVALLGDAELDEGAIWEAIVDPMVPRLGEVLWIVDLNRQSLDRIVPDIAAGRIGDDVRGRRLADDHGQVRALAARAVRARGRRGAAQRASTRCPTRSTSGCCAPTRRAARAPARRRARPHASSSG